MFSFFRKSKKKPQTKNSTYYYRENQIQVKEDLKLIFDKKGSSFTKNDILFQGLKLNEINVAQLEKQFGEESFLLDHDDVIPGHKVFFYKKFVEKFTLLIQLHFINDIFISATTKVSAEALISDKDKEIICHLLLKNYPDIPTPETDYEYDFSDQQGNIIYSKDLIYLHIHYIAGNPIVDKLKKDMENTIFCEKTIPHNENRLDNFI